MCGQLGFSSAKNSFNLEKIKILAVWNSLERGVDATGFYSPKNGLKTTLKRGSELINDDTLPILADKMLMAHFRAATVGDKTNLKNVHPFHRGNYILQHNGTIQNYNDLLRKYNLSFNDYNVDSDIICGSINTCNNIEQVLSEIKGPAAIIITKVDDPYTLYVFRNTERPLYKGMINNDMYISSIEGSLKLIGCTFIKQFEEDCLYTIKDGLIKDKVKIVNKPYNFYASNPVTYTPNNLFTGIEQCYLALGSWLRSLHDIKYKNSSFSLVKGDYYFIERVIDKNSVMVYCPKQKLRSQVSLVVLNQFDIIKDEDICKLTKQITRKDIVVANNGDFVRISTSYGDGEVACYSARTNAYIGIVTKVNMIKVKSKSKINQDTPKDERIDKIDIIVDNAIKKINQKVDEVEEEVDNAVEDYDLHVYSENLSEMFGEYNTMLTSLKNNLINLKSNDEIEDKIDEIIDFNFNNFKDYIVEPEKIEQNANK